MTGQTFNTFWHGGELSPLHWACLSSFVERGHSVRVFGYRELKLPRGVAFEDARAVINERELFEFQNSFSAFSNIFRYRLLLEHGGWWVDTDVYCLQEDIPECHYAWAWQDRDAINGAILKFPAGDATLEKILVDGCKIGKDIATWGELGPLLLTKHLAHRDFSGHYGSTSAFYPVHWLEPHLFWLPAGYDAVLAKCASSPFVHLWATRFRYCGIDISLSAPEGSFLRHMHHRHGFCRPLAPLTREQQRRTTQSINSFLSNDWVRKTSEQMLGYDVSST